MPEETISLSVLCYAVVEDRLISKVYCRIDFVMMTALYTLCQILVLILTVVIRAFFACLCG